MDDEIACPRCKTTKYRNPSLKLLVNVCGHGLCENCVELLFVKGSGSCPECNTPLRRSNFRLQIFENSFVEKEVDIRRKVLRDFNKREEDFDTLRDYNDYLEEIECIIYNLVNNVDIESTKRQIEQYKKENKAQIMKNKSKVSKDEELLEELLEQEKRELEFHRQHFRSEERNEQLMKIKQKETLIDDLMFSDLPANEILSSHAVTLVKKQELAKLPPLKPQVAQFSSGIQFGKNEGFLPVPKQNEENTFKYEPLVLELLGPPIPSFRQLNDERYTAHVRASSPSEEAGGFQSILACQRAMQEAFCGLFLTPSHCSSQLV